MKSVLSTILVTCALVLIIGCQGDDGVEVKPNVLFISIDDLRPTLGVYDEPIAI